MKKNKTIYLLVAICACIILFDIFLLFRSYDEISRTYESVQSKYDFTVSSYSLLENIKDAESAKRGYLLTENKAYLENYYKASFRINFEKERFKKILAYKELSQNEKEQINQLLYLVDLKSAQLKHVITLKTHNKSEEAITLLKSYNNINLFDSLENNIKKINSHKKYQEIKEKKMITDTREQTKLILTCSLVLVLIILIAITMILPEDKAKNWVES
ncbi:CHASE3 domain-containing protein [Pedobacter glucosidilyticus]|uniref:CHASE3 domain-containing protein n=1 Tax=Pedobacter glucosidilyticus TaxID=1122941 RepID=UPI0004020E9D|nr:CHASE3 domain-containing protein [Pedobacter glucosidilyticus]